MVNFNLVFAFLILASVSLGLEYEDFILGETVEFVKTDAGEIRALMGSHDAPSLKEHDVAISRVILEPLALLLPHYMDAALVFYVQQGEATVGLVHGKTTVKKELTCGDVYSVPAGTVLYVLNTNDSQKLELVGAFDTSASLHRGKLEAFFVAGGIDPKSALSGFHSDVLAAAFKVSEEELSSLLSSQDRGAIIRTSVQAFDGLNYLESALSNKRKDKKHKDDKHKEDDKKEKHKKDEDDKKEKDEDDKKEKHKKDEDDKKHEDDKDQKDKKHDKDEKDKKRKDEVFNLYSKRMFENEHGWIASTMGEEVEALSAARFSVSVVKLRAGSLLAPHWNPEGAEFGLVTKGRGNIQIAFSNGTNAVDAELNAGTVFYVPQFLPVCQIAAHGEDFEFVTFSVSPFFRTSTNKGAQFIAGQGSVLQKMDIGILALAFNLPDHLVNSFLSSQEAEFIFPSSYLRFR